MAIAFYREKKETAFLDPRADFQERTTESEIRLDPLTGFSGRVAHFHGLTLPDMDFDALQRATEGQFCPFCPEKLAQVTPKFPKRLWPQGRIELGNAIVFPNLSPYDAFSAVTVLTRDHRMPATEFSIEELADGLEASITYFRAVQEIEQRAGYCLLNWNYLPAAGASQIHPHMQVFATNTAGNVLHAELEASARYAKQTGRSFWSEYLEYEEATRERFVGRMGNIAWLVPFVPFSIFMDAEAVFEGKSTLTQLQRTDLIAFAEGLKRVFAYMASQHLYGFNLAFYPAEREDESFWLHARISARGWLNPAVNTPDVGTIRHLYNEPYTMIYPEQTAEALRSFFT